jgi:hypothetical protein
MSESWVFRLFKPETRNRTFAEIDDCESYPGPMALAVSGLQKPGVRNARGSISLTLQTPKPEILFTLSRLGVSHTGSSRTRISQLAKMRGSYPWVSQVPKRQNQFTLHRFGISHTGFRDVRRRGVSPLGFPEAETPKPIYTKLFSGFHRSVFHDVRRRGVSHLGFPKAKTPKPIYTELF